MIFMNERKCQITDQIAEIEQVIVGLTNRIRGLEDLLDNPNVEDKKREQIETELVDIKDILDKNKDFLKKLHKDNTKTFMVTACFVFIFFLIYGFYCMSINN